MWNNRFPNTFWATFAPSLTHFYKGSDSYSDAQKVLMKAAIWLSFLRVVGLFGMNTPKPLCNVLCGFNGYCLQSRSVRRIFTKSICYGINMIYKEVFPLISKIRGWMLKVPKLPSPATMKGFMTVNMPEFVWADVASIRPIVARLWQVYNDVRSPVICWQDSNLVTCICDYFILYKSPKKSCQFIL